MLRVDNLKVSYGLTRALKGFSMQLAQGQVTAVLGTNGAGKTTLLRTLSGFPRVASRALDMKVEEGEIHFADERIDRLKPDAIVHRGITHVPEGREVFRDLSVEENLWMGTYGRAQKNGGMEHIYQHFPVLAERRKQRAETLSGGEQQMLAIGRALMALPELIIFDEISLGLAPKIIDDIYEIIPIIVEHGTTVLLIEQNVHRSLGIADRAYILERGRVTLTGSAQELIENKEIQEAYFGLVVD